MWWRRGAVAVPGIPVGELVANSYAPEPLQQPMLPGAMQPMQQPVMVAQVPVQQQPVQFAADDAYAPAAAAAAAAEAASS